MRALVMVALVACGAKPPQQQQQQAPEPRPTIVVEWKIEGDGDPVDITLVVDGKSIAIGPLNTVSGYTDGPATCALRAAHPLRTEIMCGDANYYTAELEGDVLVIMHVDAGRRTEIKRIPVYADGLVVKALRL